MNENATVRPATVRWHVALLQSVFHGALLLAISSILMAVVPHFTRQFQEFDLSLPVASVLVVNLSELLVRRWFVALPSLCLLFALDVALLLGLRTIPAVGPVLSNLWFAFVLAGCGLLILLIVVGLVLPANALVEGLS